MGERDEQDERDGPDDEAISRRNALTILDWFWILLHFGALWMDCVAFSISLQRKSKGAYLFGGHTQFLGNWSIFISIASHAMFLVVMFFVEPFPDGWRYRHRERQRRDSLYRWCARFWAILIPFSAVATAVHCVLFSAGEMNWPGQDDVYDLWFHFGVGAFAWFHLVACRPKQWMYGASRFILRREVRVFQVEVGQSGVHATLWVYIAWVSACRLLSGRWAYSAMTHLQRDATVVTAQLHYLAVVLSLQGAGWLAWRVAYIVAPEIKP